MAADGESRKTPPRDHRPKAGFSTRAVITPVVTQSTIYQVGWHGLSSNTRIGD
jgi:hypothetical protein